MFEVLDDVRPTEQVRQRVRVVFVELHCRTAFIRVTLIEDDELPYARRGM